jgi:hypothetical protein
MVTAKDNSNSDNLDKALHFDSLHEAEKITGCSYKEDKDTSMLGMDIQMVHSKNLRTMLKANKDLHHGISEKEVLDILYSLGFNIVFEQEFTSCLEDKSKERYRVHFHPVKKLLFIWETFGGDHINGGTLYGCWKPKPKLETWYEYTSSGSYCGDVWCGSWDYVALRHNIEKCEGAGEFVDWPWGHDIRPWIIDYAEVHAISEQEKKDKYKVSPYGQGGAFDKAKARNIDKLPNEIQVMIARDMPGDKEMLERVLQSVKWMLERCHRDNAKADEDGVIVKHDTAAIACLDVIIGKMEERLAMPFSGSDSEHKEINELVKDAMAVVNNVHENHRK